MKGIRVRTFAQLIPDLPLIYVLLPALLTVQVRNLTKQAFLCVLS